MPGQGARRFSVGVGICYPCIRIVFDPSLSQTLSHETWLNLEKDASFATGGAIAGNIR